MQDDDDIRERKKKDGYKFFTGPMKNAPKGQEAVRKAQKQGQQTYTFKKVEHTNKNSLDPHYVAKIMNDEEDHKPPSMPHDLKLAISQQRNEKGWTQQQFAQKLGVPRIDVNRWESGKQVPTGNLIAKMDKVLGVKLPRPNKH